MKLRTSTSLFVGAILFTAATSGWSEPVTSTLASTTSQAGGIISPAEAVLSPAVMHYALDTTSGTMPAMLVQDSRVAVTLKQDLKSGISRPGDRIRFEVAEDVWSKDGRYLLIPAGTPAYGTVEYSSSPGILGRSGKLRFTCDYLQMKDGARVPVCSGVNLEREGDDNRIQAIFTTLMSNHLGFLTKGGTVVVREGARFDVTVCQDTPVIPTHPSAADPVAAAVPKNLVGTTVCTTPERILILRKVGDPVVGAMLAKDESSYRVSAAGGEQTVRLRDVKRTYALASVDAPATQFVFLQNDGATTIGSLLSFDGTAYRIGTHSGVQNLWASNVRSVYGLATE